MESLYFLIPIALIFVAIAIRFLYWAINSGQYDNLDTEAHRILFDDDLDAGSATDKTEKDKNSDEHTSEPNP
ncbi:MAG TPA: cbb3-type cytochrome oxidase assembly protein CcoS [Cellvibrionaceae bacterium]